MDLTQYMQQSTSIPTGIVASGSQITSDPVKWNTVSDVQSGVTNEFVTGEQPTYVTFQDKFEILRFSKTTNSQEKQHVYHIRSTDVIHLQDLFLYLTVTFTRTGTEAKKYKVIDENLIDNLVKRVSLRLGAAQEQRNKADPIEGLFKVTKLINLGRDAFAGDDAFVKYTSLDAVVFEKDIITQTFAFGIPLWLFDSTGLFGLGKVYPGNNLIELELTFENDLANVFFVRSNDTPLAGLSYTIPKGDIRVRTTTVNSSLLRQGDEAIKDRVLQQLRSTTGMQIDPSTLTDTNALAQVINSMDAHKLNSGEFMSFLSTPVHMYSTQELACSRFTLPSTTYANQILKTEIQIQQQMVVPKAMFFFLRAYTADDHRLPMPPMSTGPVQSFNIKMDGRRLNQFEQESHAERYIELKHALGRQDLALYHVDDKGDPDLAIYGMVCNQAGNPDYEVGARTANLILTLTYNPAWTTAPTVDNSLIAKVDLILVRQYTQQINIDTNGQVVFIRNTV